MWYPKGYGDDAGWYKVPVVGGTLATWNPSDKNANVTLSGGNLIATAAGAGSPQGARATNSASSSKKYHEASPTVNGGTLALGIANATHSLTAFLGDNVNSIGWYSNGIVQANSVNLTSSASWTTSDVLCFAIDLGNDKIWFRVNGGNWDNNAGHDPATNTGGYGLTANGLSGGPYFPAMMVFNTNDSNTANFGATAFAQTPPSGFGNW